MYWTFRINPATPVGAQHLFEIKAHRLQDLLSCLFRQYYHSFAEYPRKVVYSRTIMSGERKTRFTKIKSSWIYLYMPDYEENSGFYLAIDDHSIAYFKSRRRISDRFVVCFLDVFFIVSKNRTL